MNIILNNLTQNRLLTSQEEALLRNTNGSRSFLTALIGIYEDKTKLYLRACQFGVKKTLQSEGVSSDILDRITVEKTMDCAYQTFLELYKFSPIPSLKILLERRNLEILTFLGLNTVTELGESMQNIAERVFVGYTARHRLFHTVDFNSLQLLCQEVQEENPTLFPSYLLDAWQLESQLSQEIKTQLVGQTALQSSVLLAQQFQFSKEAIKGCLKGIIIYLGILANPVISPSLRAQYFGHLNSREEHLAFTEATIEGYMEEMEKDNVQLEVMQAHTVALGSAVYRVCLPALKLLGMPVEIDLTAWDTKIQEIQNALNQNQINKTAIEGKFQAAKNEANQKIDQWRANVPDRPVTFGFQLGFRF